MRQRPLRIPAPYSCSHAPYVAPISSSERPWAAGGSSSNRPAAGQRAVGGDAVKRACLASVQDWRNRGGRRRFIAVGRRLWMCSASAMRLNAPIRIDQ